jgi:hypothetical protein
MSHPPMLMAIFAKCPDHPSVLNKTASHFIFLKWYLKLKDLKNKEITRLVFVAYLFSAHVQRGYHFSIYRN